MIASSALPFNSSFKSNLRNKISNMVYYILTCTQTECQRVATTLCNDDIVISYFPDTNHIAVVDG